MADHGGRTEVKVAPAGGNEVKSGRDKNELHLSYSTFSSVALPTSSICTKLRLLDLDFSPDGDDESGRPTTLLVARMLLELRWRDQRLAFGRNMRDSNKKRRRRRRKKVDLSLVDRVVLMDPGSVWTPDLVFHNTEYKHHLASANDIQPSSTIFFSISQVPLASSDSVLATLTTTTLLPLPPR